MSTGTSDNLGDVQGGWSMTVSGINSRRQRPPYWKFPKHYCTLSLNILIGWAINSLNNEIQLKNNLFRLNLNHVIDRESNRVDRWTKEAIQYQEGARQVDEQRRGVLSTLPHLRQPAVRPETERRTAIRQTVPNKASVEAETSTITKVVFNEFHFEIAVGYSVAEPCPMWYKQRPTWATRVNSFHRRINTLLSALIFVKKKKKLSDM